MSVFVKQSDIFDVEVFVTQDKKGRTTYASTREEVLKAIEDAEQDKVEKFTVTFRQPNYQDNIEIIGNALMGREASKMNVDVMKIQYTRFAKLLVRWDFKEDGKDIEATPENINRLHPNVASAIVRELDELASL